MVLYSSMVELKETKVRELLREKKKKGTDRRVFLMTSESAQLTGQH